MRLEIITTLAKPFTLRLVPETPGEQDQLRDLRGLGLEEKVGAIEFAVPRRRKNGEAEIRQGLV